ncbi:AbrB/MazE/SpoVT family DNA-binding domain-containing protein [Rhodopseudomonas palustris]|uniref:AbrB/MazE/SpoVT family DNA-binding domain-containing protein n=1 Tax=Rhodopseudomonas palustris TaxID=1076 RepID=UPI0020CF4029|nr:AbrB/MazE/SpoVT family DNA-binding domain-containing protein [Rhodopseudomonas palustris]MCP9627619.1 AbrB/MazE/SpoVT family DNA-binding domain-containing protein [Rhodopseudomonas palustris]
MASKVTSDGRVTIPKDILDMLKVAPGGEVDFRLAPDGAVVVEKVEPKSVPRDWEKARGSADAGLSSDELMQVLRGDG